MDFKFGWYIYKAYPNKSPLKVLEKRERVRIQGLPKFFGCPVLSREWVKLPTSNFVGTFIGSIGTKAHDNVGNSSGGRSQGVPNIFRAPIGALRGHLCDSTAFLSERDRCSSLLSFIIVLVYDVSMQNIHVYTQLLIVNRIEVYGKL